MEISNMHSLQKLNTFGIGVTAGKFVRLNSKEQIIELIKTPAFQKENKLVIGEGSNILFTRDFDGWVVKVDIGGIHVVGEDKNSFLVKAGAGVVWDELVNSCVRANFGGIENLSLIPGTVGAAPIQNIGAYGVELKDTFEALEAIHLKTGEIKYFLNKDCQFGYRDSIFKNELKDQFVIINVVLRLAKRPVVNIQYGKIGEVLDAKGEKEFSIKDVSDAIIKIRREKLPDPKEIGNAGSFFKNPVVPKELLQVIKISYPDIPSFDQPDNTVKIPAAWLIEKSGLKGIKHHGAAVHIKQPLVLVNNGDAAGKDILELAKIVQDKVKNIFGILLDMEVRVF